MINEKTLQRIEFGITHRLTKEVAEELALDIIYGGAVYDELFHQVVIRIKGSLLVDQVERVNVKYPSDWWQAVKDRWFPKWLLKHYPIQYITQSLSARILYPHMLPNTQSVLKIEVGAYDYSLSESVPLHP